MEKFFKYREIDMLNTFDIKRNTDCVVLQNWLKSSFELSDFENMTLDVTLNRFERLGIRWNEEELKMHFISSILNVADPNIDGVCKTFFKRPLEGVVKNYQINIVTDCMIASSRKGGDPDKPYFFLQEFKQSQRFGRTDPQGQMLAAMLLAQKINDDNKYIYGCYVIVNNWYFTTLNGLDYCRSRQFDATQKTDLVQIVYILRELKNLILNR